MAPDGTRRPADRDGQAQSHHSLGYACELSGRLDEARAVGIAREARWWTAGERERQRPQRV
jgi:hypothetical protein